MTTRILCILAGLVLVLTGCSSLPKDPDGTLARSDADRVIHVGISHAPPLTDIIGTGEPGGTEADLVREFAASRGVTVEWTRGGEEQLVTSLEEGHLDLVVGGISAESPWSSKAAMTRPWGKAKDALGDEQSYVFLAPLGENALIVALERFFDARKEEKK